MVDKETLSRAALAVCSGVLVALSLPRVGACALGLGGIAPLILAIRRANARPGKAFLLGWLAGFSFFGVAVYWIFNTCLFAGTPVWVGALAWSSLAAFLGLHWGLTAALGAFAAERLKPAWRPWAWAAVWTAAFGAATAWGPRLCADLLGYTQWKNLALVQVVSVVGTSGLGFLVAAINGVFADAFEADLDAAPASLRVNAALCALLYCAGTAWGGLQLLGRETASSAGTARVALLQPNVDQYQKWDIRSADRITANFDELISSAPAAAPDLVIWPESSIPRWVEEGKTVEEAAKWSRELKAFQIVGVVSKGAEGAHNGAFLIGPDGSLKGSYFKRELVPFGEYVPFAFLKNYIGILDQMGDLSAGRPEQPLLETPLGRASVTICYEAAFPRWARLDASRGARLLVNITNDGWYRDTWGPYEHFWFNRYRAVENRAEVLRSGNTGISAVIDPWGVVTAKLDLNRRGRLDALVPRDDLFPARSFYARHGDWVSLLCGVAAAALFLLSCLA